jgi:rubredoxin
MAEYIKREAVIDLITRRYENSEICTQELNSIPAADVAPVVHGRWENGNPICPVCGEDKFKDLDADIWCDWQPDFCPNCGAKMDEGADHRA